MFFWFFKYRTRKSNVLIILNGFVPESNRRMNPEFESLGNALTKLVSVLPLNCAIVKLPEQYLASYLQLQLVSRHE